MNARNTLTKDVIYSSIWTQSCYVCFSWW